MKVYIVIHSGYEFSENMGVFKSRDEAEEYRQELITERVCDEESGDEAYIETWEID